MIYLKTIKVFITTLFNLIWLEKKSNNSIEEFQYKKLKKIITKAYNNVPFYKKYWDENNFNPRDFQSLDCMSKIPFLDKNIVRDNGEDLISSKIKKTKLSLATTAGTTGLPTKFYIEEFLLRAKEILFLYFHYRKFKAHNSKRVINFKGLILEEKDISNNIFWKKSKFPKPGIIMSAFHLNNDTFNIYYSKILELKPRRITGYPSVIARLCLFMKQNNLPKLPHLELVRCSSEVLYDWQRKLIEEVLEVNIISHYGCSEKIIFGGNCIESSRIHINPFYSFNEVINSKGKPCSNNEIGELVVTGFDHDSFPFIRYKMQDMVKYSTDKCECGRDYLICDNIIGRQQEQVIAKNGDFVSFAYASEVIWGEEEIITGYQYVQNKIGELDLLLECNSLEKVNTENILLKCQNYFPEIIVHLKSVDKIERTSAGKWKYFIQNVK